MDDQTGVYSAMVIVKKVATKNNAYWIPVKETNPIYVPYENEWQIGYAECSGCHVLVNNCGMEGGYPYCPICGSKMSKE